MIIRKGIVTAVIAGVASAGINFGLQGAPELEKAALSAGASPTWAGMPVLTVVLWGGLATQILWVGWKWKRLKSGEVEKLKGGDSSSILFWMQLTCFMSLKYHISGCYTRLSFCMGRSVIPRHPSGLRYAPERR